MKEFSNSSGHLYTISHGGVSLFSHVEQFCCHNTLSVLSYDAVTKHQFLLHSAKRPLFTKSYNNGQLETLTLCIPSLLASI